MESLKEHYQRAWKAVIAPTKYTYNISSLFSKEQPLQGYLFERIDLQVLNDDGKLVSAVIIKQKHTTPNDAILYFHGNGGTKIQILGVVSHLAQQNTALIAFDFVGCGNSDNGYLTYGINEASDAEVVLRQAYKYINVERLSVWGRSMGAVTAINFAVKNPKIVDKLILDSPFRFLESVVKRVIHQQTGVPQVLANLFTYFISKQCDERVKFALFAQDYLNLFKKVSKHLSIMFISSHNDTVVPKEEVQQFYKMYKGDKQMLQIGQSHEEDRGPAVYNAIVGWIKREKGRKNMKLRLYRPMDSLVVEKVQVYSMC